MNTEPVVGVPVKDTIKVVGAHNNIDDTPNRDLLWAAQTPNVLRNILSWKDIEEQ